MWHFLSCCFLSRLVGTLTGDLIARLGCFLRVKSRNAVLPLCFLLAPPPGRELGLSWASVPSLDACRPLSATLAGGVDPGGDISGRLISSGACWIHPVHPLFLPRWAKRQWRRLNSDNTGGQRGKKYLFLWFKPLVFVGFFSWWEEVEKMSSRQVSVIPATWY